MKLGTWLLAMCEPLLGRILASLGMSVVTIVGMSAVIGQLKTQFVSEMGGLPSDMLNLFLLSGGGVALGMIFGAVSTRVMLWQIQNATKILGKNS